MRYDFTTLPEREGHDAIAVDLPAKGLGNFNVKRKEGFDVIPMWVADMNFNCPDCITDAVKDRLNYKTFGYFQPREEYYNAIINWQKEHNGIEGLKPENIGYENGVLGGVISAMNIFCSKGDKVLVHSPTYVGFTHVLHNNGYDIVHSPLVKDENGVWRMDFADMEEKLATQKIHTAIMCNPHNPCGRVLEKEELEQAMALFEKYHVYVISDEIWSDLLMNGAKHIPTQTVSEYAKYHTAAFYAPSKTFNLAGLIGSYHIIYDPWIKDRIDKEASLTHYNAMNVLSMYALIGAFSKDGNEWLKELKEVLSDNVNYACEFIEKDLEGVSVFKPQGTYMLFINCREYCEKTGTDMETLYKRGLEYGVCWQSGKDFCDDWSLRLNLALPLSRVAEAFRRMKEYIFI